MIGEHLNKYTFEYILQSALSRVSNEVDKREGRIIYDAIAPSCYELAEAYKELRQIYKNTFADEAAGEYLDMIAGGQGVFRRVASPAVRLGRFYGTGDNPIDVPEGSRFRGGEIIFIAGERIVPGEYRLTAETSGTAGNVYIGDMLPITNINGLKRAEISEILVPGENAQTDESLRREYFEAVKITPFGGNQTQYRREIQGLDGVGAVQIYPVWNGGGTVKCVILTSDYNVPEAAFVSEIQSIVDPEPGQGLGIAPIGHNVTISGASEKIIDISAEITTASGITPEQVKPQIRAEIEDYFSRTRREWGEPAEDGAYSLYIFAAQVSAAILRVNGVLNVSDLTLNNQPLDIVLKENKDLQELPVLGVTEFE